VTSCLRNSNRILKHFKFNIIIDTGVCIGIPSEHYAKVIN